MFFITSYYVRLPLDILQFLVFMDVPGVGHMVGWGVSLIFDGGLGWGVRRILSSYLVLVGTT